MASSYQAFDDPPDQVPVVDLAADISQPASVVVYLKNEERPSLRASKPRCGLYGLCGCGCGVKRLLALLVLTVALGYLVTKLTGTSFEPTGAPAEGDMIYYPGGLTYHSAPQISPVRPGAMSILVVGDWGCKGSIKDEVAADMDYVAGLLKSTHVISTGDNFYDYGVADTHDKLWSTIWKDPYTYKKHLASLPWFPVLGNHDYLGNVVAQFEYTGVDHRWHFYARQYSQVLSSNGHEVAVVFIDTNPYDDHYWKEATMKKNFEKVHADMHKQTAWLDNELSKHAKKFKIVVGHHPIYSGGGYEDNPNLLNLLKPVLEKHNVNAYISGHSHAVEHIYRGGSVNYVVVGSGCKLDPRPKSISGTLYHNNVPAHLSLTVSGNHMQFQLVSAKKAVFSASF